MKHLKLFESFNQDNKIGKVNDYFEKSTEVTTENDGTYSFFAMTRLNRMRTKKRVMYVSRRIGYIYIDLNDFFLSMRLKRYLIKWIGNQYYVSIQIPIENYLRKKFKFTEEKFEWHINFE